MTITNATRHIDEALALLTGEVYRGTGPDDMKPVDGICTLVLDLQRIDASIGKKGESIFARMADTIQTAYVEITAAKAELKKLPEA